MFDTLFQFQDVDLGTGACSWSSVASHHFDGHPIKKHPLENKQSGRGGGGGPSETLA